MLWVALPFLWPLVGRPRSVEYKSAVAVWPERVLLFSPRQSRHACRLGLLLLFFRLFVPQPFWFGFFCFGSSLLWGPMAARPRLDDPSALQALLDQLDASQAVRSALTAKGFLSLGSLAFAVADLSDGDQVKLFVQTTLGHPDGDVQAQVSSDAACIRRLLMEAQLASPLRVASGSAPPVLPPPSGSPSKIAAPDLLHLRKTFLAKYPGELLTPETTPSLDFLSLLKSHHDTSQSIWVPWRLRTCESDALRWEETRRPRNDRHLLRVLLDSDAEPATASVNLNMQGPPDPILRRSLSLFATALAMLDFVHLATIKRFHDRFLHLALTPPMDQSLRPPSLQEIVHADRTVWLTVSELLRDFGWSLADSLNEVAFCRGDMATLLQPRPRPPRPPPGPPLGKGDRKRLLSLGQQEASSDPPGPKKDPKGGRPGAKAKATPNPPPKGFDASWHRQINGKEACMRFAIGKCTKDDCRFVHACPVPLPNGKPCGQPRTALEHAKASH